MSYSFPTTYRLSEFPQLREFLEKVFDAKSEILEISTDGKLVSAACDNTISSYEHMDYQSLGESSNITYDDFQRSADMSNAAGPGNCFALNRAKRKRIGYRGPTTRAAATDVTYEQYANAVMRHVDPAVLKNREKRCWKFVKIVYDGEKRRVAPEVAAMCINRMFSMSLKHSMVKYRNDKHTRAALQLFRSTLRLMK